MMMNASKSPSPQKLLKKRKTIKMSKKRKDIMDATLNDSSDFEKAIRSCRVRGINAPSPEFLPDFQRMILLMNEALVASH